MSVTIPETNAISTHIATLEEQFFSLPHSQLDFGLVRRVEVLRAQIFESAELDRGMSEDIDMLYTLVLQRHGLSQDYTRNLSNLFARAVETQDAPRLGFLSANMEQRDIASVFIEAARSNRLEHLRALLSSVRVSDHLRSRAVMLASAEGHLQVVQELIRSGPIIQAFRSAALAVANTNGFSEIVEELRTHATISELSPIEASRNPGILTLSIDELVSNPEHYLDFVVERGFPKRVIIPGSEAVDIGGLRKAFVTQIVQALTAKLCLNENQLPLITSATPNPSASKELYRKYGVFLSQLLSANKTRAEDPFLTGHVFHPGLFEILKVLLTSASEDEVFQATARILQSIDPNFALAANVILNPDNQEAKDEMAAIFGFNPEETDILQEAKSLISDYLEAPKALLTGLSDELKDLIRTEESSTICSRIQGEEASIDSLIQALHLQDVEIPQESDDIFLHQKYWLKEKILSSDLAWRKSFLQWATGRETLSPAATISLQSTNTQALAAHTCFNSIEFPKTAVLKDTFLFAFDNLTSDLDFRMA